MARGLVAKCSGRLLRCSYDRAMVAAAPSVLARPALLPPRPVRPRPQLRVDKAPPTASALSPSCSALSPRCLSLSFPCKNRPNPSGASPTNRRRPGPPREQPSTLEAPPGPIASPKNVCFVLPGVPASRRNQQNTAPTPRGPRHRLHHR